MTPTATRDDKGAVFLEFPYHRGLIDGLKREIPARGRTYDPTTHFWIVEPDWATTAERILLRFLPHARIVGNPNRTKHTVDRPRGQQEDPDLAALYLRPGAPPELVKAAYRTLSKLSHPDVGGDTSVMQKFNAAYERLRLRGAV